MNVLVQVEDCVGKHLVNLISIENVCFIYVYRKKNRITLWLCSSTWLALDFQYASVFHNLIGILFAQRFDTNTRLVFFHFFLCSHHFWQIQGACVLCICLLDACAMWCAKKVWYSLYISFSLFPTYTQSTFTW